MSEITAVSSAAAAYSAQAEAVMRLLSQTLEMQQDIMSQLLESLGIGTQLDVVA